MAGPCCSWWRSGYWRMPVIRCCGRGIRISKPNGRVRLAFGIYSVYFQDMSNLAQVLELKNALSQRFPNAQPIAYRTSGAVATGIEELDNFLPASGLPRGRVSLWTPGGGATALLYAATQAVAGRGERAAWIDGAGTIAGDSWKPGALLLKPEGELESLICAEELLRSGGFGLVVLSGAGRAFLQEDVRLSR